MRLVRAARAAHVHALARAGRPRRSGGTDREAEGAAASPAESSTLVHRTEAGRPAGDARERDDGAHDRDGGSRGRGGRSSGRTRWSNDFLEA